MAKTSKDKGDRGARPRRIGKLKVPERLKRSRNKKSSTKGLPDSAWRATNISGPSVSGHQQAGPIMQYDDDT